MNKRLFFYIALAILTTLSLGACMQEPEEPEQSVTESPAKVIQAEDTEAADTAVTSALDDRPQEQEPEEADNDKEQNKPDIIWIGDSLTQGSLGDDNRNENNPQAPWRVLGELSGLNVAGAGYYGYNTNEIFWVYGEHGGIKDPDITYIYWVGSNDFFKSPDSIDQVIEEIDKFNTNGGITRYLVLGTTDRHDMEPKAHIGINRVFEETYGDRYLDVIPYLEYGPDGVHLTEGSYAAVAGAVYEKLKQLNWF